MALTAEQELARAAAVARGMEPKPQPRVLESNITPELCAAVAQFQAELPRIEKDRRVEVETKGDKDNYSYDYATLENVNYNVIPKLGALGLAFISMPTLGMDGRPALRYYLTHSSGGYIAAEYPLRGETYQAIGSAITYIRRYAVQGVTGVAAPEEDDGGLAADADTGPRTAARRSRADTAARNTAAKAAGERPSAQRRPAAEPTSGAPAGAPAEGKEFSAPRNPDAPISNPQAQRLAIQFGELGITQKEARVNITGQLVGRSIASSKELTMGEAHTLMEVIDGALKTPNPVQVLKDYIADVAARPAPVPPPDDDTPPWDETPGEPQ